MLRTYFQYKQHPGDLLRDNEPMKLPHPEENLEEFLVWFLHSYQSDGRVALIDDLSKALHHEFDDEAEELNFLDRNGIRSKREIQDRINCLEEELKGDAYRNFYSLLLNREIKLITRDEA